MGVLYSAFPLNDEVRKWLTEDGIRAPETDGRAATPNEIKRALDTLDDQAVSYTIGKKVWQAQIDDLRSPKTGPWALLIVLKFTGADEPCKFYFEKGWPEWIVKVVHRIAQISGPIVIVPDTGCPAAVVTANSDIEAIISTWGHIQE